MGEWKDYWWNVIPGPANLLSKLRDAFQLGCTAIICGKQPIPFVTYLSEWMSSEYAGLQMIDKREATSVQDTLILDETLIPWSQRRIYRPCMDAAGFLTKSRRISGFQFFIILKDADSFAEWFRFMECAHNAYEPGQVALLMVIEGVESPADFSFPAQVPVYQWEDCFSRSDLQFFSMRLLSEFGKVPMQYREYFSLLAALLSRNCPEWSVEICERISGDYLNLSHLEDIIESENLESAIRLTQLFICFPLLEINRNRFLKEHERELSPLLPITIPYGKDWVINDVSELEFSNINYFYKNRQFNLSPDEYNAVTFWKNCRNTLAHSGRLNAEDVFRLIDDINH